MPITSFIMSSFTLPTIFAHLIQCLPNSSHRELRYLAYAFGSRNCANPYLGDSRHSSDDSLGKFDHDLQQILRSTFLLHNAGCSSKDKPLITPLKNPNFFVIIIWCVFYIGMASIFFTNNSSLQIKKYIDKVMFSEHTLGSETMVFVIFTIVIFEWQDIKNHISHIVEYKVPIKLNENCARSQTLPIVNHMCYYKRFILLSFKCIIPKSNSEINCSYYLYA